ncbi:hypothetical protein AYO38_03460 [bacterium SCGC AG-212-C10]|nr:hypothetical protein AYO38_03460 [bacterium SCGC AG-212-C10]
MRKLKLSRVAATVGIVVAGAMAFAGIALGAGGTFTAPLTGAPASPQSALGLLADWDIQIHDRGDSTSDELEPMEAEHGPDCGAPPATHHLSGSYKDAVFQCKDHIMTALNSSGYGLIYLTPNQMLDFGGGGSVAFDVSTAKPSSRDWIDVWISPWADNLALPFNMGDVDLQGPPNNAINVSMAGVENVPVLTIYRNGSSSVYNAAWNTPSIGSGVTPGTNQSATRQRFVLTVTANHVKFERLASTTATAITFFDVDVAAMSWKQGVVQWGHHSYNPTKDGAGVPATHHWDNFTINPAIPFTIIHSINRSVRGAGGTVSFASPAPAGAMLRFGAVCKVKINGQLVDPAVPTGHPEHFSSYFVPIAAGTTQVSMSFADDGWYTTRFGCAAEDFAIWSPPTGAAAPPLPASTPTTIPATATATSTSKPNTPTATASATPTRTASATPTRTSSATPAGTPSATPTRTATASPTKTASATATQTASATPTRTTSVTPSRTATPTRTPTRTATPSPTTVGGTTKITFDTASGQNRTLSGMFPTAVIDWGTNTWFLSAPWGPHKSKSISFNGNAQSQTFTFVTPKILQSFVAGGTSSSIISVSCTGNPTVLKMIPLGKLTTITTGWKVPCKTVTIGSTNGWDTNFDDVVIR